MLLLSFMALYAIQALGADPWENYNLCANGGDLYSCSGYGDCINNSSCSCTSGYTGRDCSSPSSGFPYSRPAAAATYFCQLETGGCTGGMCIGGASGDLASFTSANLPDGISGIAAVNPTLYGSRYFYSSSRRAINQTVGGAYSYVGQGCGACFKLTKGTVSVTVTVIDRCAGDCKADASGSPCEPYGEYESECGICQANNQKSVPVCSCYSPNAISYNGICNGKNNVICDWCAGNDHPHFDLDQTTFTKLCQGDAIKGHCDLDSFQSISCSDFKGPWPNGHPTSS